MTPTVGDSIAAVELVRTWRLLRDLRRARTDAELAELQDTLLRAAVRHAWTSTPAYRQLWAEHGFDPTATHDLARVPILDEAGARSVLASARGRAQYTTSGSAGPPVVVPRGAAEQRLWRASGLRAWLEHGARWTDTTLRFDSQPAPGHALQRLGISRTVWVSNELPLEERVDRLLAVRPEVVVGTPTVLRRVCAELEHRHAEPLRPKIVFSQGEILDRRTADSVERWLGVVPAEIYGLTELGYVAWQCKGRDALHVNAEAFLVELIHEGRPARPGEVGRVVVTDLRGRSAPLIRYDTGDLARAADGPCACGHERALLARIEGRRRSSILGEQSLVTTRTIVDGLAHVVPPTGFRVRQDGDGRIHLELAPAAGREAAADALAGLVGPVDSVTTTLPAPDESAEKTQSVVSGG
jgi:phenylacetate-CoA ligase